MWNFLTVIWQGSVTLILICAFMVAAGTFFRLVIECLKWGYRIPDKFTR